MTRTQSVIARTIGVLALALLTLCIAAAGSYAAQGSLSYQAVLPSSHSIAFSAPTGVAYLPNGSLAATEQVVFVADPVTRSVMGVEADGTLRGPWTGVGAEKFVEPTDVATDISGHIYVADKGRAYIYKLDATTGALIEKLGSGLVSPVGIDWQYSAGGAHNIYVACAGGKVVRLSHQADTSTGFAYTLAGTLQSPADVDAHLTSGGLQLWVTDTSANKVVCIDALSGSALYSWGTAGTGAGQLSGPMGVAVRDGDTGHVVVSDGGGRVQRFTQAGVYQDTLVSAGVAVGQVMQPQRIALDIANDWMWIAEKGAGRVQVFNSLGDSKRVIGGGPGTAPGTFSAPRGLAADAAGALYVADTGNNRVQRIDASGMVLVIGSEGTGDGQFRAPTGIAIDRDGAIYVSDTLNNRIQKFSSDGTHLATWGSGPGSGPNQFNEPKGIAVDSRGYIYVADYGNNRIQVLAPNGDPAGSFTGYEYNSATQPLWWLSDLAVGPDDSLYLYDGWGARIVQLDASGGFMSAFFTPNPTLYGRYGGLDVSRSRTVYAVESDPGWDPTVWVKPWLPGLGDAGYHSFADAGGGPGQLAQAGDIALGPLGTVWVSDMALHRIECYQLEDHQPPFTNWVGTDPGSWYTSGGVTLLRPTDGPAGPIATWVSVDGAAPSVIWSASEEATANPTRSVAVSDEGTHTVEFWAVDDFGNQEETNTVLVKIDKYFPEATATISPTGWTTGTVEASVVATDSGAGVASIVYSTNSNGAPLSGPVPYTGPVTFTEESNIGVRFDVTDGAGKSVMVSGLVQIDRTPPVTLLWLDESGDVPWLWGIVTGDGSEKNGEGVTWWRVDSALPVAAPYVELLTPGPHTVGYWTVDPAGNVESEQTTEVAVVGRTGGDFVVESFQIGDGGYWFNSRTVSVASDVPSALQMRFIVNGEEGAWQPYAESCELTLADDGGFDVVAQFRNGTDESADVCEDSRAVAIDTIPPVTTSNAQEGRDFTYPEPFTFVPDDGDGSGPAMTEYRLNGGAWAMGSSTVVAPGTHTLGWRSRDLAGNIESEQTTSVTVLKAPMSVSLTSKSATISYGASYVLSGRLTSDGVPQTSMRVVVQYLSAGVWKDTSVSAYTDVNGNYRATIKYSSKHTYRVSFPADAYHLGATSTSIVVTPRAYVGTPKAPTTMSRTKYYTVYGYLKPRHTQGTYPVRIYKWRKTASGSWKSEGYVKAKASNYSSYSKYSRAVRLTTRGTWRLRAYSLTDSLHAGSWSSGYDYVKVK